MPGTTAAWLVVLTAAALPAQEALPPAPDDSTAATADATRRVAVDPPGSGIRVYLVTFGQGDAIWEPFGHNALWVHDPETIGDVAYNWGMFDFGQVDFVPRFLKGEMLYTMAGFPVDATLAAYERANRSVWIQELALTPEQKIELRDRVRENDRPGHRDYRYDYFLDNCSTRVRDHLDAVLDGRLAAAARSSSGESWRFHTRRLTRHNLAYWAGIDLLLGPRGDQPITRWDAAFVPMVLQDVVRDLEVPRQGSLVPLVASETTYFQADRPPEAGTPGGFRWVFAAVGLVGALVLVLLAPAQNARLGRSLRTGLFALAAVFWSLVAALLGTLLTGVWFTDHAFMYWNENWLQFSPLSWILVAALMVAALRGRSVGRWGRLGAQSVAALSILGFLLQLAPGIDQSNGEMIALALPVHAALAWTLGAGRSPTPHADRGPHA